MKKSLMNLWKKLLELKSLARSQGTRSMYTNNLYPYIPAMNSEKWNYKIISFLIMLKCLEINYWKMQDRFTENYKILHVLEDSILLKW